jgi:hypothetical protein
VSWTVRLAAAVEDPETDAFIVGLAERADGGGRNLIFQCTLDPAHPADPADVDGYCLTDEVGATVYGGVLTWSIDADTLNLTLESEAAATLGLATVSTFPLGIPPADIATVSAGMSRVLASAT